MNPACPICKGRLGVREPSRQTVGCRSWLRMRSGRTLRVQRNRGIDEPDVSQVIVEEPSAQRETASMPSTGRPG